MKIGVFGDSYADPNPWRETSWIHYLSNEENIEIETFSASGTSHWWSYKEFLNNYTKFDVVIFCHTSHIRWPYLPKEYQGREWNVGHEGKNITSDDFQKNINRFFDDVFEKPLLEFISSSIIKEVNHLCKQENIYLINLSMDADERGIYQSSEIDFPILTNLDRLSRLERTKLKGKEYNTCKLLSKLKTFDVRANHLSPANNRILAKLLHKLISEHVMNLNIDLMSNQAWSMPWEIYDVSVDEKLKDIEWWI
jgi:hypothetical protein